MLTLNTRYLPAASLIASSLEQSGFTVATIDEVNRDYEGDQAREFKQNLSAHDWHTEAECCALESLLWKFDRTLEHFVQHNLI